MDGPFGANDWRSSPPADVLAGQVVLTMEQVAYVLGLMIEHGKHAGRANSALAVELVRAGRLRLVDPSVRITRWRVSAAELRRYVDNPGLRRAS